MFHILVITQLLALVTAGSGGSYSYNAQGEWPSICGMGLQQSPIDINWIDDTKYYKVEFPELGVHHVTMDTAGRGIKYSLNKPDVVKMPGTWPVGANQGLQLLQMHLHWGDSGEDGAEHHLFSTQYQGELHLVTRNLDQNNPESDDYYAVFGVFLEEVDQVEDQVVETLFESMITGNATTIDLSLIYPTSTKSVFTYEGSLTTPGCEEHVFWQVLEVPVKLSTALMTKMRSHGDATFREVQQLNGRHITHRQFGQLFNDLGDEEECGRRVNGVDPVADFCVLVVLDVTPHGKSFRHLISNTNTINEEKLAFFSWEPIQLQKIIQVDGWQKLENRHNVITVINKH